MDATTGVGLFATIAEAAKKIGDILRAVKDHETKEKLNEVYDTLTSLKQNAANLEDQNRELKERLRFKSEDFEFRRPFYYDKKYPERPLCPRCFVDKEHAAPMGEPSPAKPREVEIYSTTGMYRQCLVCGHPVRVSP